MKRFNSESNNKQRPQNPRINASIFEILTYSWMLNLFKTGRKRDLEENDLYTTLEDHKASMLGHRLEEKWKLEMVNAKNNNRKPSLLKALIQTFGSEYMFYGFLQCIEENCLKIFRPLLIGGLLSYFNPEDLKKTEIQYAYTYAFGLMLIDLLSIISFHFTQMEVSHCGMKIRIACSSVIYRKALKLSHNAFDETTNGQVINLISNDINRFDSALATINYVWIGPLQTIVVIYFLWQEIGVSSLFGIVVMICFILLQGYLWKTIGNLQQKMASKTDERLRLINEIISGIQVIKMYTWEKPFSKLLRFARKREITLIKRYSFTRAMLVSITIIQTKIQLFASIIAYVLVGNYITVQKMFVVIALCNILHNSMTIFFRAGMGQIAELLVSVRRIQKFLLLKEKNSQTSQQPKSPKNIINSDVQFNDENSIKSYTDVTHNVMHSNDFDIEISNATAKWSDDQTTNSLENINLTVKAGQLAAIIGPVGSGKSSLMHLILRELPTTEGKINVRGIVSYASQQPWLFTGSIERNILFDSPKDEERYREVIRVCALISDFEQFPHGDKTIVGEKGITLSGGQRARISLARAVYKKADIYLLDDPLSAVDSRVGKHLFEKCIKDYLKGKTCILITHQIQFLTKADQIVLMDNASIAAEGSYQDIRNSGYDIASFIRPIEETIIDSDSNDFEHKNEMNDIKQKSSFKSSKDSISSSCTKKKLCGAGVRPVDVAESRSSGLISKNILISYFSAVGSTCKIVMFFSTFIITQVLATGVDLWLNFWLYQEEYILRSINSTSVNNSVNRTCEVSDMFSLSLICQQTYIIVYAALVILLIIACIIRSVTFATVMTKASFNLHSGMFNAIIRATMYFFNTNSSGRILNRFSNDIGAIDGFLPLILFDVLQIILLVLGVTFVVVFVNIYLIIPTIIFGLMLYSIRYFYLHTSLNVKRLEAVTRSPVLSHMNESLHGLMTVRAYKADKVVTKEFDSYQDLHSSAWYLFITSNSAFGFWIDFISLFYVHITIFSFLLVDNNTFGGNVGLVITQIMFLTGLVQWGVKQSTILENQITSVERVLEYTKSPQEPNDESSTVKITSEKWPDLGQIVFKNFYLRYSPDSPYVLKNLNFKIQPMEKIGIIGRTGAGKSSIISALFRLALNEGNIIIDDIEIHELGLHDLRSKLSIIPQEPFLFSGTMRNNLDPFDEYPDHVLWKALEEVKLKIVIESLPGGLNSKMSENGSNLSVGQRQLVCLARAIVRNRKILILDEATANVDPQTDTLIQKTIRNKFRSCTVLTIAHRLNTVIDSDKILVMDDGSMVEFGHPFSLLQDKNGFLCSMVEQTGQANANLLHRLASESFQAMRLSANDNFQDRL